MERCDRGGGGEWRGGVVSGERWGGGELCGQ